jgi:hypothetical protein
VNGVVGQASWAFRAAVVAAVCAAATAAFSAAVAASSHVTGVGSPPPVASSSASPSPSSEPSPTATLLVSDTLTTAVVRAVTVHSGSVARVRYRADDIAGGIVTMDLLVTTRSGEVRRRLVSGRVTAVGVERVWRGRIRLRRGRYLLCAHAVDGGGRSEAAARTASLRVRAPLPPLVPTASARRAAFAWAAQRAGHAAVAVVDSRGDLHGYNMWRPSITASVVKAMLLVTCLRQHRTLSDSMRATLTRMITASDNAAADAVYAHVGRDAVQRLAHIARMRTFRAGSAWIVSRVAPADMARFFRDMEEYIPAPHRRFANGLLSHIVSYQRWGIPVAAEPLGYRVYFKPGWLGGWTLANEAARLEKLRVRIGLTVFTEDNPTSTYGRDTIAGITARLLRR